ncbi:MAG TPA: NfeD family protein [Nostocaceae cyanobacterium]|nr:NfeD family protein [Nostocaceae cyanobacterium]
MPNFALIWLLVGFALCLMEFFLPSAFVEFIMGLSALMVAILALIGLSNLWLQIIVWVFLSITLFVLSHRYLQPRSQPKLQDAVIAETLTEIPKGKAGRVLYEGNSWRARCDDDQLSLLPNQKVYVVGREGTTLIVMPENVLDS